jgi:multicomponent Na+:H+ antiporter subunit E
MIRHSAPRAVLPIVVLAALWVALSGKIDPVHLSFGAFSVALTAWMTRDLRLAGTLTGRRRAVGRMRLGPAVRYPFWLLKEIALANVQIAKVILDPRLPIDPLVIRFDSRLHTSLAQVLLANSITLTPGTFTMEVRDSIFSVHALTTDAASPTALGGMRGRVAEVFGEDDASGVSVIDVRRGNEVGAT